MLQIKNASYTSYYCQQFPYASVIHVPDSPGVFPCLVPKTKDLSPWGRRSFRSFVEQAQNWNAEDRTLIAPPLGSGRSPAFHRHNAWVGMPRIELGARPLRPVPCARPRSTVWSGCRESNSGLALPKRVYYHCTTSRPDRTSPPGAYTVTESHPDHGSSARASPNSTP